MIKRKCAVILSLVLAASALSACGKADQVKVPSTSTEAVTKPDVASTEAEKTREPAASYVWHANVESPFMEELFSPEYMQAMNAMIDCLMDHGDSFSIDPSLDWYDLVLNIDLFFPVADRLVESYELGEDGRIAVTYQEDEESCRFILDEFAAQVEWWINNCVYDGYTDLAKAVALYHEMSSYFMYDYYAAETDNVDVSPYRAIMEEAGICQSFAGAYSYMLIQLGLDACCTGGMTSDMESSHVWSQVKLDGDWYYCDVTFENGFESPGLRYFGMNDQKREQEGDFPADLYNIGESNQLMGDEFHIGSERFRDYWDVTAIDEIEVKEHGFVLTVRNDDGEHYQMTVE